MKALILSIAAFAFSLSCATAQVDKGIVTKPDLIGHISQSGTNLIITVSNMAQKNPHNASGKARNSSAKLILDGQSQTIQVPELLPDSEFKKAIPIPASLVSKSFAATLIVDAGTVVPESNENNNKFTGTFNAPDLTPLLVNDQVKFREEGAFYYLSVKNVGIAKSVNNVTGPFRTTLSKDLGKTWIELSTGTGENVGTVHFNSATLGYGGEWQPTGHATRMYKYAGSPLTGLLSGLALDARATLSPNPTADQVNVEIEVAEPAEFLLLFHDAQGRLMERRFLEKTSVGNARFDLSHLPAGVYTLSMSSQRGYLTRAISKI